MIEASCHCGALRLELPRAPRRLLSCNCSICRRNGGLWAYYDSSAIRRRYHRRDVETYAWGDRMIRYVRCRHCGCVLHHERTRKMTDGRVGVNMRNCDPAVIAKARVRRFDGAETWKFLD
ncbi:MAG TPA: hypothetical protein VNO53_00355 [Steroidobacteraceae bacterium]|nr:hypothetical protein [Steroidobacteraceae bacterium]